jgi:uncharacterized protein YegL
MNKAQNQFLCPPHYFFAGLLFLFTCCGPSSDVDTNENTNENNLNNNSSADCINIDRVTHSVYSPAAVRVIFRVLDCDGYPVRQLTAADVTVINDEKGEPFGSGGEGGSASAPTNPENFEFYSVLALDMSDSIVNGGAVDNMISGAEAFVQKLVVEAPDAQRHRVAIVIFGRTDAIQTILGFTDDAQVLFATLDNLRTSQSLGTTNLYGAYIYAIDTVKAAAIDYDMVERTVVILTDGTHEAGDEELMRTQALNAKTSAVETAGVSIFSIGIRGAYDEEKLRELASKEEYFVIADNSAALVTAFGSVAGSVENISRSNYVIGICTPVELGYPTLTINVNVDGRQDSAQVAYATATLTGDVSDCNATLVASPCQGRLCGEGYLAGLLCGTCLGAGAYCTDGFVCADDCEDLECGSSPTIGANCGTCVGLTEYCDLNNQCVDDCLGRCGTSPLGFDCGGCSGSTEWCNSAHLCVNDCAGIECGSSPVMGFDCGDCLGTTEYCSSSNQCIDDCLGRECGSSPIGGFYCGSCPNTTDWCDASGNCVDDCLGRVCGSSPHLGVSCGLCSGATDWCTSTGQCVDDCAGLECGSSPNGHFNCGLCLGATDWCNTSGQCIDDCLTVQCGPSPHIGADCGDCGANGTCDTRGKCLMTLATGQNSPWRIAVDSTSVYFLSAGAGSVRKVPKGGGSVTDLATGQSPYGLALDTSYVYWTNNNFPTVGTGSIVKVPVGGGSPTPVAEGLGGPTAITQDGLYLYWLDRSTDTVNKISKTGGTITILSSGQNGLQDISVSGSYVYFIAGPDIRRVSTSGGTTGDLANSANLPWSLAADSTNLFFANYNGGTVSKIPIGGGAITNIVSGQNTPYGITVDATQVFWSTSTGGTISTSTKTGSSLLNIVTGQTSPTNIAVDATDVYWITGSGNVMKVGK